MLQQISTTLISFLKQVGLHSAEVEKQIGDVVDTFTRSATVTAPATPPIKQAVTAPAPVASTVVEAAPSQATLVNAFASPAGTPPPLAPAMVPVLRSPEDLRHGAAILEQLATDNAGVKPLHAEQLSGRAQEMRRTAADTSPKAALF